MKEYLLNYFIEEGEGFFKSKETCFGMSPRHDYKLWVYFEQDCTVQVMWKNSISQETIFIGDGVKTEQDFEDLFRLLDVLEFIKGEE